MKLLHLLIASCLALSTTATAGDACLVGTWEAVGDGAGAWMARNLPPGLHVATTWRNGGFRFDADGRYAAHAGLDAQATLSDGSRARTRGPAATASEGRWETEAGHLLLQSGRERAHGAIEAIAPDGTHSTHPLPIAGRGAVQLGYTCSADALVTRKTFPGIADPLVQRYRRVR